jgi:hypothetical protein
MGGILLRTWLAEQRRAGAALPAKLGRVVMLAPQNQGSESVDHLRHFPPYRWIFGANGLALGTTPTSLPRTLGPWPGSALADPRNPDVGQLGIIAGDRSINPLFALWVPSPNDGPVRVAATHLDGQQAHRLVHASHTGILWRTETARAVTAFLHTGRFD